MIKIIINWSIYLMQLNELRDVLSKQNQKKMKKAERKKIFDEIHNNMILPLKEDQIKNCMRNSSNTLQYIMQKKGTDYSMNNEELLLAAFVLETIIKSESL